MHNGTRKLFSISRHSSKAENKNREKQQIIGNFIVLIVKKQINEQKQEQNTYKTKHEYNYQNDQIEENPGKINPVRESKPDLLACFRSLFRR